MVAMGSAAPRICPPMIGLVDVSMPRAFISRLDWLRRQKFNTQIALQPINARTSPCWLFAAGVSGDSF
jgi:hypothetical protein